MRFMVLGLTLAIVTAACGTSSTAAAPTSPVAMTPSFTPPSPASPSTQQPSATPDPTEGPLSSPIPTMPPFPGIPSLSVGGREGIEPSVTGGCRTVYYLVDFDVGDQCGPFGYDAVLASKPAAVATPEEITLIAPPTYVFSVADTDLDVGWLVKIAPASALKDVGDAQPGGIPGTVAQILASGLGPNATVIVRVQKPGGYVLEFASPMSRDGWTFVGSLYYWLISVG